MTTTLILLALLSAASDAGARADEVHSARELPAPAGSWVAVTERVTVFHRAGEAYTFTVPELRAIDPRAEAQVQALNPKLRAACLPDAAVASFRANAADVPRGEVGCGYALGWSRGPFLDLVLSTESNGAYPSSNARQFRIRLDTGKPWGAWEAIAPAKRKDFVAACSAELAKARAAAAAKMDEPVWAKLQEDFAQENPGHFTGPCREAWFRADSQRIRVDAQGTVTLEMADLPHVAQAANYEVQLGPALLAPRVDEAGPLGALAKR